MRPTRRGANYRALGLAPLRSTPGSASHLRCRPRTTCRLAPGANFESKVDAGAESGAPILLSLKINACTHSLVQKVVLPLAAEAAVGRRRGLCGLRGGRPPGRRSPATTRLPRATRGTCPASGQSSAASSSPSSGSCLDSQYWNKNNAFLIVNTKFQIITHWLKNFVFSDIFIVQENYAY